MSVILFEPALRALLDAPQGPVMRDIQNRGERAAAALQSRIDQIIENPILRPQAGLLMTDEGAIVGIPDEGRISEYLDFKLEDENWWDAVGRAAAE